MPAGLLKSSPIEAGVSATGDLVAATPAQYMGFYCKGTDPANSSVWHELLTGCTVLDKPCLSLDDIPPFVLAPDMVRVVNVRDPETGKPLPGLSLIKVRGVDDAVGFCGGKKRRNATYAQPLEDIYGVAEKIRGAGGSIESVFWLDDGRFVIDGTLPLDATHRRTFGQDRHFLRFGLVGNYSGQGTDCVFVSLVRAVCTNMTRVAMFDAKANGDILKVRHSADVSERWTLDVSRFVAGYSAQLGEHVAKLEALNAKRISEQQREAFFKAVLGDEPEKGKAATTYAWKIAALRAAYTAERENAQTVGLDPDSARVAYETVTNVLNHGGAVDKGKGDGVEWYPVLNTGRTTAQRAWNVAAGADAGRALALALAGA